MHLAGAICKGSTYITNLIKYLKDICNNQPQEKVKKTFENNNNAQLLSYNKTVEYRHNDPNDYTNWGIFIVD